MAADDNRRMNTSTAWTGGAVRLLDWGVIRARGDDAATFLHGQLTQDVQHMDSAHARLAAYCSPKGRLLASFVVVRPAADELWLACSADLLAATLKRLSMFVLRARCRLDDASAEIAVWGLAGRSAADWLGDARGRAAWDSARRGDATIVRLPAAPAAERWLALQPAGADGPPLPAFDAARWAALEAHSGVARIVAATADRFVPQMLNYEVVGGIDFRKGCYPGQEVVARSQYRGTIKRRALPFHVDAAAKPGDEVFHSEDPTQPAGMVANVGAPAADRSGGCSVLVEIKLAAVTSGTLALGAAGGPVLHPLPMPYDLPADSPS
jgi:folate-binding protein YgfZ